jgi:hypothetical protein
MFNPRMKAILVRIGVDQAFGHWNAPVNSEGRFVYIPIPEKIGTQFRPGLEHRYSELQPALERFCADNGCDLYADLKFPTDLLQLPIHLDPDFEQLTYGDDANRRGAVIAKLTEDDLLIFYAGMRPTHHCEHKLVYALIGLYVVHEVVRIDAVPPDRWRENAHTRKMKWGEADIIVRAKSGQSGRLERCIPIGEYRDRAYRVSQDLLSVWGGLKVKNGYIQRSIVPPLLNDPNQFYDWFLQQNVPLIRRNN